MQSGPTPNDILTQLNNAQYLYHNLKLDEKSSYLTTFACQFGGYKYKRLLFEQPLQEICSKEK